MDRLKSFKRVGQGEPTVEEGRTLGPCGLSTIWGRALLPEAMGLCLCNAESLESSLPGEKIPDPESVPGPPTQGDQAKHTTEGLTRGEGSRKPPEKHRASEAEPNVGVERRS